MQFILYLRHNIYSKMKYTLFIILFILTFLGTWQVYRWHYKQNIMIKLQQSAITLPNKITQTLNYAKININFSINGKDIIYVYAGKEGYFMLVPVKALDNKIILLNIGTVVTKNNVAINENKNIEGIILFNTKRPLLINNYDNKSDTWFGIDTKEIGEKLHIKLEPYIIWVEHANIKNVKDNGPLNIYNHHVEYIVTWYGLALILMLYLIYRGIYKSR